MAFADEVVKDGRAYAMRFDVSTDNFSTISYRWSTHGGTVNEASTEIYTPCVEEVGPLSRGFGVNGVTGASSMELVLSNTDGALDWLFSRANYYNVTRLRIRAYLVVWGPDGGFSYLTEEKQLGDFYLGDFPRRDESRVVLNLVDAIIGRLDEATYRLPTIGEFAGAYLGSTAETLDFPRNVFRDLSIPLAYGQVQMTGPWLLRTGSGVYRLLMPVRCGGSTATDFTLSLVIDAGQPEERWVEVPPRAVLHDGLSAALRTIWDTATQAVTDSDGTSRTVRYLQLYVPWVTAWIRTQPLLQTNVTGETEWDTFSPPRVAPYSAKPPQRSSVMLEKLTTYREAWVDVNDGHYDLTQANVTQPAAGQDASLFGTLAVRNQLNAMYVLTQNDTAHGVDVAAGVIDTLVNAPARNAASFTTTKSAVPDVKARGLVFAGENVRQTINDIAGSTDFDIYTRWDGTIAASGDTFEAALAGGSITASYSDVDTAQASSDWPGTGERGHAYSTFVPDTARLNQVSPETVTTVSDGRGGTYVVPSTWNGSPVNTRRLQKEGRPRLRFTTDARALVLELGDFFQFTWTRNISTAFNAAYFQVQRLAYSFQRGTVEVEALWRKDSDEPWPYILDDQTYNRKATGSGGRTATVVDSSGVVTMSSGDLVADDVAEGDILVLMDATLAADNFTRFRALRIVSVSSATVLGITDADLDFDAGAGVAVSSWEIRGGALSVNPPTGANYTTLEWERYGKAGDVAVGGTFSDGTTKANKFGGG